MPLEQLGPESQENILRSNSNKDNPKGSTRINYSIILMKTGRVYLKCLVYPLIRLVVSCSLSISLVYLHSACLNLLTSTMAVIKSLRALIAASCLGWVAAIPAAQTLEATHSAAIRASDEPEYIPGLNDSTLTATSSSPRIFHCLDPHWQGAYYDFGGSAAAFSTCCKCNSVTSGFSIK